MIKLTDLNDNAKQKFFLPLDLQEKVQFRLYFMPTQSAWFFDFNYKDREFNGNKLVLGANILRMYKNIIPFGLMVSADFHIEPFKLDDFSSGRVKLYVLEKEDVSFVEGKVFNIDEQ